MRVGIDVGGTTVKIGFAEDFKIVDTLVVKTKKETLFKDVFEALKKYIDEKQIKIEAIGIGLPGHVVDNFIYNLPNVGITNVNLYDEYNKYFKDIPLKSTNDANAAALGEAIGDPDSSKSSYMITLGTGVGGGLVIDGKVIDGYHSACGEVGHMFIDYIHEYKCTCGLKGCLETVASATGIVRLAKQYHNKFKTAISENPSAKEVFDRAKENDELGVFVLDMVAKYLARGLAAIAVSVDVEVFYIGGGVSAVGSILTDKIEAYFKEFAHFALRGTKIKLAKLGNTAGMLGAAYL